jgi:sugar lactone lactonase YvrE
MIEPGKVLSTWFVKRDDLPANAPRNATPPAGLSVLMYDSATGGAVERDLLTGFGKPVGVAISHGNVYVADAANNRIVTARLDTLLSAAQPASATSAKVFAQIAPPTAAARFTPDAVKPVSAGSAWTARSRRSPTIFTMHAASRSTRRATCCT